MPGKKRPEVERLAIYGAVTAVIREAMQRKGITPAGLNQALGRPRAHAGVYHWLNANGAPDPKTRPKVAKVLGVPEKALEKRPLNGEVVVTEKPGTALVRLADRPASVVAPRPAEVLQFAILADGTSRLRLDLSASAERGVVVLRLLLDQGMVVAS